MSNPIDHKKVTLKSTPDRILGAENTPSGKVLWGGIILSSVNLENGTQIEVLSYPLDHRQLPRVTRQSTGRFVVFHPDYLETTDFSDGRLVTVLGSITGTGQGTLGEARYRYATMTAEDIYLWREDGSDVAPAFSVGIGINLSN
ncbi:MAG: Slp family lipoprotein [Granulosicoccus sp.]|nr:Slp family lipoprotein [Granulosicoccus sp.]